MRVVGAEPPLLVVAEPAFEQRAEDRRLDLPPLELRRVAQKLELVRRQVDVRRTLEEAAVRVRRPRVQAVLRPWSPGSLSHVEELPELVGARSVRVRDQLFDHAREAVLGNLAEVLGEQAPDASGGGSRGAPRSRPRCAR